MVSVTVTSAAAALRAGVTEERAASWSVVCGARGVGVLLMAPNPRWRPCGAVGRPCSATVKGQGWIY